MAQDKGKNVVQEPPMNPPPKSPVRLLGELDGCDGDGCASDPGTWPKHHVLRRGVHCRLCSSCILLSHRSLYCCRCLFLVTSPSCHYDHGDTLMAPPAPTVTCQVCRESVAHLPCLYSEPGDGFFVCPPCTAAQNGWRFTYSPPCGTPLDECDARVLVLASRMALALLQRHATASRAAAERLAREAAEARERANVALKVNYKRAEQDDPSWVVPKPPENDLASPDEEEEGNEAEANVEVLLVRRKRNAKPPLPSMALAEGTSSQSKPLFDLNENSVENDPNDNAAENEAEPTPFCVLNSSNTKGVVLNSFNTKELPLNSFNMKEMVTAAAQAASRASPPTTPQTLPLFPSAQASSSSKMPPPSAQASSSANLPRTKKPRTKRPRTLQLLKDNNKLDQA